ncbi:hypothetical protein [Massilimicrobiota timonensis]|uniref:hypothetical protein n=1 Tax=Massilimicrobiota timonensis TaxID=1776392 RepID=UPI00101CAC45|nr:hypothetical protein [Massilimicrobiota timonensis]
MAIPLGLKKEYISPMTEAQAKEKEIYYEVTSSTKKVIFLIFSINIIVHIIVHMYMSKQEVEKK